MTKTPTKSAIAEVPILEYRHVTKSYGPKTVLKDISFTIPAGKIVGLLGQNGTGKTTLIKLANGLLTPTSGEVLAEGQPIGATSKQDISYLPERTYLDKTMRVRDAVKQFSEFYQDFSQTKAEKLLKDLKLDLGTKIAKMSKGMQEKLQLALVMSRKAKLYILDEPLGGIDPATRDYILDTILTNFEPDSSMLISTHLISDVERILDHVIIINRGKVIIDSDADVLRTKEKKSIDEIFRNQFKN